MVRALLIPTNAQLQKYTLQRPNFYALRGSEDVKDAGEIMPAMGPHGLRWVLSNDAASGIWTPVDVEALRLAQLYLHQQYRGSDKTLYLFVYAPGDGRKSDKFYYTIPEEYIDVWFDEPRRMQMLRDLEPDETPYELQEENNA
jgi:hypothetical protein